MDVPDLVDYPPTVPNLLRRAVERFGDVDLFVTEDDRHLTYAEVDAASARLARRLLADGVGKGTRVGLLFPQAPEWVIAYLAVARIGGLAVTLSTFAKAPELAKLLRHGDVDTLLLPPVLLGRDQGAVLERALPDLGGGLVEPDGAGPGSAAGGPGPLLVPTVPFLRRVWMMGATEAPPWARPVPWDEDRPGPPPAPAALLGAAEAEVHPADPVVVVYTSGTTSEPKGVIHTHGALVRQGESLRRMDVARRGDRLFAGMPWFWIGGVSYTLGPVLHAGATMLTMERFEPEGALRLMERQRATTLTGWIHVVRSMAEHPARSTFDLSSLRRPLGERRRPVSGLGMTETAASYLYFAPGDEPLPDIPDASGTVMEGREVRVADPETNETLPPGAVGEICVRGFPVTVGMVKRERHETFDDDGWYHTGDKGWMTADGVVGFVGRVTEMIKTKGSNVAPPEVEALLQQHPDVKFAHVLGVPDDATGERVGAVLVPRAAGVDVDAVRAWAAERVAGYKVPTRYVVLAEEQVPVLASGKVDRLTLRRLLEERGAAPAAPGLSSR